MAGRRRRGEQTSLFNMPGARQACSSRCIAREMGCVFCSCPSVGTSATLCPQSIWVSRQHIAHCHALAGKLPKEIASSPQKRTYWGTISTMLGETSTFQPQAPLMGASSFSLHPHIHPSGLSAEWLERSMVCQLSIIYGSASGPPDVCIPFFPCAVTARPAASCLLHMVANMGLQTGWRFKAVSRAC